MNLIDLNNLTANSNVIQAIFGMLSACHAKHSDACMAPSCMECLARYFDAKKFGHLHNIITDVAPVVHGHWVDRYYHPMCACGCGNCSICGIDSPATNYCSNCGAKMDESEDSGNV